MFGLSLGLGIGTQVVASGGGAPAATLNPTNGVNKYSGVSLTNGNLTAAGDNGGSYEFVRATRGASSGATQFEVTVNSNSNFIVSIEDGTQDFSTAGTSGAVAPGDSSHSATGFSFKYVNGNGFLAFLYSGGTQQAPACTIANGDKLTFQLDRTANTIKVLLNGTQLGTTISSVSMSSWYAAFGVVASGAQLTANFAGSFSFGANAAY
jgi:hypothetical protein